MQAYHELPDYLAPGLSVLFVGFNPGERSARMGHHYAGRGNQFWNFLYESGLVPERLVPEQDHRLLEFGMGLTNVVSHWSKSASTLRAADYRNGAPILLDKVQEYRPRVVVFNGKTAYENFSGVSSRLGWQRRSLGVSRIFVLPCTSGRNTSATRAAKLRYFRQLAKWVTENAKSVSSRSSVASGEDAKDASLCSA